ncbi:MAG: UpxY family transcription antiterminator [Butyricimonas faecihominis]
MEKTNWYAVFTASRAEKRVKERLEQAGIENYLPVRKVEFVRDGLVKRLEVPVITGCIFVRVSEMNLPSVLSIGGVIALLKEKQGPVVISDEQLDSLRILNENAGSLEVVSGKGSGWIWCTCDSRRINWSSGGVGRGGWWTSGCGSYSVFDRRLCGCFIRLCKGVVNIQIYYFFRKSVFI